MQKFSTVDLRRDLVRGYEKSRDPVYGPNEARKSWWTSFFLSSIAWSKKAEKPMAYAPPTVPSLVILLEVAARQGQNPWRPSCSC